MKGSFGVVYCFMLLIWNAAFMWNGCYSSIKGRVNNANRIVMVENRKLKENIYNVEEISGLVHLEDYRPVNPVPSSKASIRPGTIHHDTPLMPYIPKHSPPSPPPVQTQPPKPRGGHGG